MSENQSPRGKILLVDDSEIVLEFVQGILEAAGYTVLATSTPFGVCSTILAERPHLVLMDMNMPALKGSELVKLIRSNKHLARTRVIFHSSEPAEALQQECTRSGADGFIEKTSDQELLLAAIAKEMEKAKSEGPT